jgi:HlyD family secretion protein
MKKSILALLALLTFGCRHGDQVALNGRVEAYLADLGPRVAGTIASIDVREGQRVKAGDLLVRLTAEDLQAAVDRDAAGLASSQARASMYLAGSRKEDIAQGEARVEDATAALALANDTLTRVRNLNRDRIASQADLDKAVADRDRAAANLALQRKALEALRAGFRVEDRAGAVADSRRAKAVLDQSRAQTSYLEIRAPFDAVVVHRLREQGSVVSPGQAILTLARLDRLWVRLYLPQPLQAKVSQGMPLQVATLDGRVLEGTLDEVASEPEYTPKMVETAEERVNLVYPAKIHLARGWDEGLIPGVAVDVRIRPRAK